MTSGTWGTWGGARPSRTALALLCGGVGAALLVYFLVVGSDGSDDSDPAARDSQSSSPADPGTLVVAGEYATEVTLQEGFCRGVQVGPTTTTVTQSPGSLDLELTQRRITHDGTLSPNGSFNTSMKVDASQEARHFLSVVGRFSSQGFTARLSGRVSSDEEPRLCKYVLTWVGTKEGAPNTVPED